MIDFEVDSVWNFLKAWLAATLLIVGYAWVDLRFNPHLSYETGFTLTPDVTRLADLWDWGGRLLHHGAVGLLALNAIALGGTLVGTEAGTMLTRGWWFGTRKRCTIAIAPRATIAVMPPSAMALSASRPTAP